MRKAGSNENLRGKPKVPSEKHDLLYSKARYVLNQRHIKRPWFNLNPFLEKTDESADLENWLPTESKYIQALESLVLCESFHSDHPIDTKELLIDAFFPYLLSGDWDKGCSVRVLEGRLLEQLLIGLYRLEKEGYAVRHTTYAFANNRRPRTGCYKLIDKEASGSIEETLLLEFAHFGRCTKEMPNPKTLYPFEYLHPGQSDFIEAADVETAAEIPSGLDMYIKCESKALSFSTSNTRARSRGNDNPKWGCHGSVMSKHLNDTGVLTTINTMNKRNSIPGYRRQSMTDSTLHPESRRQVMPTTRLQAARRQTWCGSSVHQETKRSFTLGQSVAPVSRRQLSTCTADRVHSSSKHTSDKRQESTTDKVPPLPPDDDEMKSTFPKMHKRHLKINSLNFDDEDSLENENEIIKEIEEVIPPEEKDIFFGEEFYLSDQKKTTQGSVQNARKILKRKKVELHKRRDEVRKSKEIIKEKSKQSRLPLPPMPSPFDSDKLNSYDVRYETIKMPDNVPTLEEFAKLLKEDEYYDPRYRNKMRQKKKKIAQRYYIAKGTHRASVLFNLADLPDEIRNITALRKTSQNTHVMQLKKQELCDEQSQVNLSRLQTLSESQRFKAQVPELSGSIEDIQEHAQEVLAVTDSEPCKDHYVRHRRQSIADAATIIQSIKKLTPISEPSEKVTPVSTTPVSKSPVSKWSPMSKTSPMFPKPASRADESESSETDTSSEESSPDESCDEIFDTNRLNMKYSIERLRKRRRSKIKKKPAFIDVLAKYYNMQNILRAFRKGSAGKESKRARARAKQMGKTARQAARNKEEMVIGKLRKFEFLDVKPKKKLNLDNISVGDFSSPDLAKFHQQLKDILDKFVVRREIVVSDLQTFYNALTSVTFTKLSCFQHKHKSHYDEVICS